MEMFDAFDCQQADLSGSTVERGVHIDDGISCFHEEVWSHWLKSLSSVLCGRTQQTHRGCSLGGACNRFEGTSTVAAWLPCLRQSLPLSLVWGAGNLKIMSRATKARVSYQRLLHILICVAVSLFSGCDQGHCRSKRGWFSHNTDVAGCVQRMLESEQPDDRRAAINELTESRQVHDSGVIEALVAVAENDRSHSVRRAALIALGYSDSQKACQCFLNILRLDPVSIGADPMSDVREAAITSLLIHLSNGEDCEEQSEELASAAVKLLGSDRNRNVRVTAAQVLAYYPRRDVLYGLADALEQRDFGVCFEAAKSLQLLTGQNHGHDPDSWRSFIDRAEDPFADRGRGDRPDEGKPWYDFLSFRK